MCVFRFEKKQEIKREMKREREGERDSPEEKKNTSKLVGRKQETVNGRWTFGMIEKKKKKNQFVMPLKSAAMNLVRPKTDRNNHATIEHNWSAQLDVRM